MFILYAFFFCHSNAPTCSVTAIKIHRWIKCMVSVNIYFCVWRERWSHLQCTILILFFPSLLIAFYRSLQRKREFERGLPGLSAWKLQRLPRKYLFHYCIRTVSFSSCLIIFFFIYSRNCLTYNFCKDTWLEESSYASVQGKSPCARRVK